MTAELSFTKPVRRGARGLPARRIQEWLGLHGHSVAVDGDFGPATEAAVAEFQVAQGLRASGVVDRKSFAALTRPMAAALAALPEAPADLGAAVVAVAEQHLAQHPREIGGQNAGPWVRLYMDGREGRDWAWCCGFVCFVLDQAAGESGKPSPLSRTVSCDTLAAHGRERGVFLAEAALAKPSQRRRLAPGAIFLNRRSPGDWVHTGIVVAAGPDSFRTIEGNTNDAGEREGYEVCARIRGYGAKDFIRI